MILHLIYSIVDPKNPKMDFWQNYDGPHILQKKMTFLDSIQSEILNQISFSNVVVTAPTGAGKSTQIPRWLLHEYNILMIEPRRIACSSLATRISALENSPLGSTIGFAVRGESLCSQETRLKIVTPGIALINMQQTQWKEFDIIIFDEIHERTLEQDILVALSLWYGKRILVLSATIAADSLAQKIHGVHIAAVGREYPIDLHYESESGTPHAEHLPERIYKALFNANWNKDALVFVPGKSEIDHVQKYLHKNASPYEIITLHGGQTLEEQNRIFHPNNRRRIVVSTNIAESALTIPNIDIVIDSGLERRTCYHRGRSYLALFPIAQDAAEQRKGRAGRDAPGKCIRLWGKREQLLPQTPPQIYREALEPLVLAACVCGNKDIHSLPFLDPPQKYAIDDAQRYLRQINALDSENAPTMLGRKIFSLPIDHALGRLLIEAEQRKLLPYIIPLCSSLSVRSTIFKTIDPDTENHIRKEGCDLLGLIRASLSPQSPHIHAQAYFEAIQMRKRLQDMWCITECLEPVNREEIAQCIISAWPDSVYIRRNRGKRWAWSNGGTENEKGINSAIQEEKTEAVIALSIFARGNHARERISWIEFGMPIAISWLAAAGLGRMKLHSTSIQKEILVCTMHRVYAEKTLETIVGPPEKALLPEAMTEAFLSRQWENEHLQEAQKRHRIHSLASLLREDPPVPSFAEYILERFCAFEMESVEDIALLSGSDLYAPQEDLWTKEKIEKEFPESFSLVDATYRLEYDIPRRFLRFIQIQGERKTAPPLSMCPKKVGWKLFWVYKNKEYTLS